MTARHKVMGINAGMHNGNGEIALKAALKVLEERGAEVKLINLFDYDILPCTGCEGCTMQMGAIAQDPSKEYKGCVLKDRDDVDQLVAELHTCNGVLIAAPTYDLAPSSLYLRFAQRFLAYELSFLIKIGVVKENPHTVAGLISVGGSMHDWQTLALETLQASMFTMSLQVVDRYMIQRSARPGSVLTFPEQVERCKQMGEHIWEAMETPVEERGWLGDPDDGVCPNCHSSLVYPGDPHWDGIEFPYECAVCGCGGSLGISERTGKPILQIAENGHIRDRFIDEARAQHLNEIIRTRIEFFQKQDSIKDEYKAYREMQFPTVEITR
ncbi:MAG: flavodoxin family protein [Acidobacteriota bacterium]|nr:flavodoxin family protein [Acidobacteriota bacterium]